MSGWRPEFPEFIEKQRAAEKQREEQKERQKQEVQRLQNEANIQSWNDWFVKCFDLRYGEYQRLLTETLGEVVHEERVRARKEFQPKIDALEAEIKTMKQQASFAQQFYELEQRLDARQLARDEAKRGSEMIPQGELLARIEKLQRQVDDLERFADQDARELADRVGNSRKPTASRRASRSL